VARIRIFNIRRSLPQFPALFLARDVWSDKLTFLYGFEAEPAPWIARSDR